MITVMLSQGYIELKLSHYRRHMRRQLGWGLSLVAGVFSLVLLTDWIARQGVSFGIQMLAEIILLVVGVALLTLGGINAGNYVEWRQNLLVELKASVR